MQMSAKSDQQLWKTSRRPHVEGSMGYFSPCSCWTQMSPCPPWAEAHSWPGEMGESAFASHHPDSQTASSHMSFAPPWLPVLPPGPQKNHPTHVWSSCEKTFVYHGSNGSRHRSSAGSRRPSSDTLNKLLQGQRHQAAVVLWFHHVPAQVWSPLRSTSIQTLLSKNLCFLSCCNMVKLTLWSSPLGWMDWESQGRVCWSPVHRWKSHCCPLKVLEKKNKPR